MIDGWTTLDGRQVPLHKITHQHLSNIFYYTHYIASELYDDSVRKAVVGALDNRFDGKAKTYNPKYKWEMEYLKYKRWLHKDGSIIINGVKIR